MTYIYIFFYVFRCTMTKTYQEVTGIHKSNDVWIENVFFDGEICHTESELLIYAHVPFTRRWREETCLYDSLQSRRAYKGSCVWNVTMFWKSLEMTGMSHY